MIWTIIFVALLILWTIAALVLEAPDMSKYDSPVGQRFDAHEDDAAADSRFIQSIQNTRSNAKKSKSLKQLLSVVREFADNLSADLVTDTQFIQANTDDIDAEWAVAPNANLKRRVLFLHGGAFFAGSAIGHRKFSDRLSRVCDAAVLSVNYKLLPESSRRAGIKDAQNAYHWILNNGPESKNDSCDFLLVAGDSAGGNLALMLSSWSQKNCDRQPDAVIGFSPVLDTTLNSPSIKLNRKSDRLLGPNVATLALLPRPILLWLGAILGRLNPSKPVVSPLFYDLANLPPTLIHASSSEILLGDAIRYTNKAIAANSDVTLQIWENQMHDWHLFNMGTGSAELAWQQVAKFIRRFDAPTIN